MAIGPEYIAKLLPALDELEERWRLNKISADKAIDFCLHVDQRLGIRPEFEVYRQRVRVTLDAAFAARNSSPVYLRRDLDQLERSWARGHNDNYRDDIEECTALIGRTTPRSPERARVLAVLASVVDACRRLAITSPDVHEYMAGVLDRAAWERFIGERLPEPQPRSSFRRTRSKPKPTKPTSSVNKSATTKPTKAANKPPKKPAMRR
jgi:hypothetical protein